MKSAGVARPCKYAYDNLYVIFYKCSVLLYPKYLLLST